MARGWQNAMRSTIVYFLLSGAVVQAAEAGHAAHAGAAPVAWDAVSSAVSSAASSIRTQYDVAGVAVAVTIDGAHRFFTYGLASRATQRPVTQHTLFEIGSGSKTFAAAVAEKVRAEGGFAWDDPVAHVVPALQGSAFERIAMWQLGTHTSGLPLFMPDAVGDQAQLLAYLKQWTPPAGADASGGLHRQYSNVGIGVLGWAAAQRAHRSYPQLVEHDMLPALGMRETFLTVPARRMADYAQGYTRDDRPIRVNMGVLGDEGYGVKSSAADLVRYLDWQISAGRGGTASSSSPARDGAAQGHDGEAARLAPWLAAMRATQQPWVRAGAITQDLMWEQYAYPATLTSLQTGNGNGAAMKALPAERLSNDGRGAPSGHAVTDNAVWINKTGSTNGFGAYLVFIPARRIGLVMLFNKNVPIEARVAAAARIVSAIDPDGVMP